MKYEKFGWFVLVMVIIYVAVIALTMFGSDIGSAYGVVLTVVVAILFAEVMGSRNK